MSAQNDHLPPIDRKRSHTSNPTQVLSNCRSKTGAVKDIDNLAGFTDQTRSAHVRGVDLVAPRL